MIWRSCSSIAARQPGCLPSALPINRPAALTSCGINHVRAKLNKGLPASLLHPPFRSCNGLPQPDTNLAAIASPSAQEAVTDVEEADIPAAQTEELLNDLHSIDPVQEHKPHAKVEVPGVRIVLDPNELDLIGNGLPVIQGEEWPEMYWKSLESIATARPVDLPRPHPKFSLQDLERIAQQGPRFDDVVLEHAEATNNPDAPPAAQVYNYIPSSVLGDWEFEVEPNWLRLPQMSIFELYQGLRQRNWTCRKFYQPKAEPWRLQFFSCGYKGVTGWPGFRVVVTNTARGEQSWVDLPEPGSPVPADQQAVPDLADLGYNSIFQQLYQAYAQRLSKAVQKDLEQLGYIPLDSKHAYSCPGDRLLDVSHHWTAHHAMNSFTSFLMDPQLTTAVDLIRMGIDRSGIFELKALRDRLSFCYLPDLPRIEWTFDPNNAGPLYFLVCLTLGVVIPAMRRSKILDIKTLEEDPGAAQEFARSKSNARKEGLTGVQFSDVAGLGPILNEVLEVVEFLKDPKTFAKLGARPPKGILLEGDPGTGKTLLAKALAGEAMVPFYQMSGTEFTEGIVGLGAARVRDLFKRARANAPCVIFVDEVDALGLKRAEGDGSGKVNEEREQTLNQLLTEMDGFTPDVGVVFIGATNRADLLDPALMRPGRFDRKVRMPKPDTEGRYEILKLHLRSKQMAPDVDLMQLARDLPGLVGADLANIVNEAQLNAVRANRTVLTAKDMYEGVDRFAQGEKRPPLPTTYKLPVMAFAAKEVGIALVANVLRKKHQRIELVERVSIQPKGRSYSRTLFARGTDEDYHMMTRGKLIDRIRVAMAGSIAVYMVLGQDTNFGMADIKRACRMAHKLVFYYGMSEFGITTWAKQPYSSDFFIGQNRPRKVVSTDAMDAYADWPTRNEDFRFDPPDPSDVTWHRYSDEVRKIIKACYEDVACILEEHREAVWAGIRALAEQREMLGSELRDVFDLYPPKKLEEKPELKDMVIFTKGRKDVWPYGIEWLNDAYPIPYWARKKIEQQQQQQQGQGLAVAGSQSEPKASR